MDLSELPVVNDPRAHGDPQADQKALQNSVPTRDEDVKSLLQKLDLPEAVDGEDNYERRQRLIAALQEQPETLEEFIAIRADMDLDSDESSDEEFYTPGSEKLLEARKAILKYSLAQADARLQQQRRDYDTEFVKVLRHRRHINKTLGSYDLFGTQLIPNNRRAISSLRYSPDYQRIACGSWDGSIYIINAEDLQQSHQSTPGYHNEKAALDWNDNTIISGGSEGTLNFWKVQESSMDNMASEKAHEARISTVVVHPSKKFVATTSFDQTWKLFDIETATELYQQEGHSKEVFSAAFHPDGSLLATGGLDAFGKLWDLRSGRLISNLESHIQGVYSMDWAPNGYHLATGSGDCSVKIWDLRRLDNRRSTKSKPELFSIPAHTKLVSAVKFYSNADMTTQRMGVEVCDEDDQDPEVLNCSGAFLVSGSYDGYINVWSADNWVKVGSLANNDKVMALDIHRSGQTIVSTSWDKSVKLWQC